VSIGNCIYVLDEYNKTVNITNVRPFLLVPVLAVATGIYYASSDWAELPNHGSTKPSLPSVSGERICSTYFKIGEIL